MFENSTMRAAPASAVAVLERGRKAAEARRTAHRCAGCGTPKPTDARGWVAAYVVRNFRVLCPACSRRDRPLSRHTRAVNETRWRRLEDAEREMAAIARRR